ncbi:hypothetical protein LTR96_006123 [Exophiala xenobiotica]|nr:hypothetical protein LTR96_006123 [Exophiala xenobiotica]KAK5336609.1 hypothetical protein LTR98_006915 [Exophiala xenobiotica]
MALPDFDNLPPVEGLPKGCAWGVFDKDGQKDTLGTLNLLDRETVLNAAHELKLGDSVSLNWAINAIHKPGFNRAPLDHKHIDFYPTDSVHGFDDEVHFNTQCGSQWDSLCHYGHQASGLFYNGAKPTVEKLKTSPGSLPTLDHWQKRGGLVGRGVLLDYRAYAEAHGVKYSPYERHEISVQDLDAVAKFQGIEFRSGDILIVRTGYTEQLLTDDADAQAALLGTHQAVGVAGNEDTARWIWNHHFAAVAGDTLAFEVFPPTSGGIQNLETPRHVVTLIGLGTIGISFAALHLKYSDAVVQAYDPRPDLQQHVASVLPIYLGDASSASSLIANGRLKLCSTLEEACTGASIVQEQGPENPQVKSATWSRVLEFVSPTTHLWSSTSGIPASVQAQGPGDGARSRLLVVHPFNPPHIMPLIEIVPSPHTTPTEVQFAREYFAGLDSGHRPVVIRKEVPGFVANRLAFILFREACSLVVDDVVDVQDLDTIVEASLGPRWAVTGPFKSYNLGGGAAGLASFFKNLSGTMEQIWDGAGSVTLRGTEYVPEAAEVGASSTDASPLPWTAKVVEQTMDAYGFPDASMLNSRDVALQEVLKTIRNLQER